jgi:GT2 family glycosyltransferase
MKISIIIPAFNNIFFTIKCLYSVFKSTKYHNTEVLVIDNGSTDNTSLIIKKVYPRIKLLRNEKNLGFAKACNQGAHIASGDMLIFLNNDTEVTSGWISAFIDCITSKLNIGVVGCKLLYPDKSVQHAGVAFGAFKVHHIYRNFSQLHPATNKPRELQAVTAACMLVPRKLFLSLGGFDESFINGFEDLDFCFRARSNGAKVIYTPDCVVIHHESKTPGRHTHHERNARLFTSRWQPEIVQDMEAIHEEDGLRRLAAYEDTFGGNWYEDTNPNPFWIKAQSLAATGNHAAAEIAYGDALSFNPYDVRRLAMAEELGDLYTLMGRFAAAAQSYDAVLRIQPSDLLRNKRACIGKASTPPSCRHR